CLAIRFVALSWLAPASSKARAARCRYSSSRSLAKLRLMPSQTSGPYCSTVARNPCLQPLLFLSTCLFIFVLDVVGTVSVLGGSTRELGRCLVPEYEITDWLAWLWDSACGKRRRAYPAALV